MAEARQAHEKWKSGCEKNLKYEYAQFDEAMVKWAAFKQKDATSIEEKKAKEREALQLQREKKKRADEAAQAAAKAAAEATRTRKVFVCGDARGALPRLFATVGAQVAKVGNFDAVLCVGALLPDADAVQADASKATGASSYLSGKSEPPLDTYFIDADAALLHAAPNGKQFGERLHFLGGYGFREICGLRVAFLSGRYDPATYEADDVDFVGSAFTAKAVRKLQALVSAEERKRRGVDLLLTCGWPAGLTGELEDPALRPADLGAQPFRELCVALEPRYHVFGTADLFFQQAPFKASQGGHVCRCIGLGNVGSTGKQRKWMHALALSPMAHMRPEDLRQLPDNVAPSPFSVDLAAPAEPPAKRLRRTEESPALTREEAIARGQRALDALLSGDASEYREALSNLDLQRCNLKSSGSSAAAPAKSTDSVGEVDGAAASSTAAPTEEEAEKAAKLWLKRKPGKGVVRYTFTMWGPIGLRLSKDVPPWILEVKDDSLAYRKSPRMPLGGIVLAINGYELTDNEAVRAQAMKEMGARPLVLDVQWPLDQGMPSSQFA